MMNADGFRQLYDYHFTVNRRIWDKCVVGLTDEQFERDLGYSHGSIHNQMVHMMSIDERWFSGLRGTALPDFLKPADYPTRPAVRAYWDQVERQMRDYLGGLTDSGLIAPMDNLQVWQVLIHVVNHGTDHRAQVLAMLNMMDVKTFPQDFIFHLWGVDPSEPKKPSG
jgi:uncharacterized damage-inducible protein DinB